MELIKCDAALIREHFEDFAKLYEELLLIDYPWLTVAPEHSREHVKKLISYLEKGTAVFFSVLDNGRPVGFIHAYERGFIDERRIFVDALMVHADYRKMSLGTRLMEAVESYARENGLDSVEVMVTVNNPGAVRFYEKNGMETVRLHKKKNLR